MLLIDSAVTPVTPLKDRSQRHNIDKMEPSSVRRVASRSPVSPSTRDPDRSASMQSMRSSSTGSETSASSGLSNAKRQMNHNLPTFAALRNQSMNTVPTTSRPVVQGTYTDGMRLPSITEPGNEVQRHRPRQHSQGYFEPSMPSASLASQSVFHDHSTNLKASRIAAQAAMHNLNVSGHNHVRRRSQTIPIPQESTPQDSRRSSRGSSTSGQEITYTQPTVAETQYRNGLIGSNAATTAASVAFPRNMAMASTISLIEDKESKKGGLKRFRPKNLALSRDKDKELRERSIPSPVKMMPTSGLSKVINASTTSLAETLSMSSNNSSMYQFPNHNQSTSTITPMMDGREKSHKHHGLRSKLNKLKEKDDHYALPLSSASSNSRPVDVNNPQSLYSFTSASPAAVTTLSKSVSGLDLRHAGRALREKKKEEKAQSGILETVYSRESETSEWPPLGTAMSNTSQPAFTPYGSDFKEVLAQFGLHNMSPDDAWDFLKAKLLVVFEGEDVRIAVEDLNRLVTIHIQQCVQKKDPSIIIGDLEEMLQTGFRSMNYTLRQAADERLVPHLVAMWIEVFGKMLPFLQAVFLPLDKEFKGRGTVLTSPAMAAEFWGALPNAENGGNLSSSPASGETMESVVAAGEELEVRRLLLITFRDIIILPRFEVLKTTFSRLSLESINATLLHLERAGRNRVNSLSSDRPGTAHSLDPTYASYNSQSSTLLGTLSSGGRSRAASNLSTGSNPAQDVAFQSFSSPPAARPGDSMPAQVTESVGRMLQCLSVLCSVQTGDDAQAKMEELTKQLKLNWLGRGRTGRNRKGFVGGRIRPIRSVGSTIRGNDREGSPTPTPTRQGTINRPSDESSRSDRRGT